MAGSIFMQILNILSLASIYVLIALGLFIVFGLMGVINIAHGELYMIGAYTVFIVQTAGGSFGLALVMSFIVVGLLGTVIEKSIIKRLYARPLDTLLATAGLSLFLRELVKLFMGSQFRMVIPPLSGQVSLGLVKYPSYRLFLICFTLALIIAVVLVLLKTKAGLQCRAVISNRQMASALGINTSACDTVVFSVACGLAGLSGAVMSALYTVAIDMGAQILAKTFCVIILGGLSSIAGVIGGSLTFSTIEVLVSYKISNIVAQIIALSLCIIIIRMKPKGLFGSK